jgi:hypothetical protein
MLIEYFEGFEPFDKESILDRDGNLLRVLLVPNRPPSLARFASTIGVDRRTLNDWATAKHPDGSLKYPEFADSYRLAKTHLEAILFKGGIVGAYQPNMTKFAMMNLLGWKEQGQEEAQDSGKLMPNQDDLDAETDAALAEAERLHAECVRRAEEFKDVDPYADDGGDF